MASATASTPSNDAVLSVSGLSIRLPPNMERPFAVQGISFDVRPAEILCIIGESGSGKSVTANSVMGLLAPSFKVSEGNIRFGDLDLLAADAATLRDLRGRRISMIFQDPLSALNPLMTIGEQIKEVMHAHGVGTLAEREARVLQLLEEVGLPDPPTLRGQYPFRLSGGQRQRAMIAMALALDPDVLIADEPTTALDVTTQAQIIDLIRRTQARKHMSVIFITHDFGVVAEIADRVIVMEKGKLVEQGEARVVLTCPDHAYTKRLLASVPRMRAADAPSTTTTDKPLLDVRGLRKTYVSGGLLRPARIVKAVNDVSFTLTKGRTLGIVGESGSGKSTLGRLVLKLIASDAGQMLFEGQDIAPLSEKAFRLVRQRIQMIFQDPFASLNPRHVIERILTAGPVAMGMAPAAAREKAFHLLNLVGLGKGAYERYPHEFSGGQRQRVGIARALMFDPVLLVADEAVSALDVSIQAQILALLEKVRAQTHVTMMFITHDLRVASQICDEVAVMCRGEIVERGPPAQVFRTPAAEYTQRLVAAIPGTEWEPIA